MREPTPEPSPASGFARTWARRLHEASFVPHRLSRTTIPLLDGLTRDLAATLRDPSGDPVAVGRRVGAALVAAQLWSPAALRITVELFHEQLPGALIPGAPTDEAPAASSAPDQRIGPLLGALTEAFADEIRVLALTKTDEHRRHERAQAHRAMIRAQNDRQHALLHDQLTGLPNRAALADWLGTVLTGHRRPGRIGLCALNLARFSELNDALGVDQGDALLREVGRRIRDLAIDHGLYAAHLGGDEFLLVAQRTRCIDDAVKVFDLVRQALAYPWRLESIKLEAKAGLLERDATGATPAELLRTVTMALAWAKRDPHEPYVVFDQRRHDRDQRRHALSRGLPGALERHELRFAYQPIVRVEDRTVAAVEALARWNHPAFGPIGPAEFIPLVERIQLLNPLFSRLLRHACTHAKAWQHPDRPVSLAVNVSTAQLREAALPAIVEAALDESGLPPHLLELEITEEAFTDPDTSRAAMAAISRLGARFAIDDFGTGHANFARIADTADAATTTVKIDRSMLAGITPAGPATRAADIILPALVDLGHRLGLTVVAEGVETAAQAAYLRTLGCDLGQGRYFGGPDSPTRISRLLRPRPD